MKHLLGLKLLKLELNKLIELTLINAIASKLNREYRKQHEMLLKTTELPDWEEFSDFLQKRSQVLENIQRVSSKLKQEFSSKSNIPSKNFIANNPNSSAQFVNPIIPIYKCQTFHGLSIEDRIAEVQIKWLCYNCLEPHRLAQCHSNKRCRFCTKKHHSLIQKLDV